MAIQSFFRPRRPRTYEHKYIYWDARQDALNRRVERIRNELIAQGEIDGEETHEYDESARGEQYDTAARIRGRFATGTDHLRRQLDSGVDRHERAKRMIRLMLMLLGLGAAVWYFFFRG